MRNEAELQKEIKEYLEYNGWEVKTYIKREDTKNWTHSYEADLLIKHPTYKKLGWIGIELKDDTKSKTPATALKQVITKYQKHYFEGIKQPINIWIIITNQYIRSEPQNIGNPYITNSDEQHLLGYKRVCQQFGVAFFDWKVREKNPRMEFLDGPYGPYSRDYYNLIDLRSEATKGKICLEIEGMKHYETNQKAILNFIANRTQWQKHINKNNMGFLDKNEFKEVNKNGKLFDFI